VCPACVDSRLSCVPGAIFERPSRSGCRPKGKAKGSHGVACWSAHLLRNALPLVGGAAHSTLMHHERYGDHRPPLPHFTSSRYGSHEWGMWRRAVEVLRSKEVRLALLLLGLPHARVLGARLHVAAPARLVLLHLALRVAARHAVDAVDRLPLAAYATSRRGWGRPPGSLPQAAPQGRGSQTSSRSPSQRTA